MAESTYEQITNKQPESNSSKLKFKLLQIKLCDSMQRKKGLVQVAFETYSLLISGYFDIRPDPIKHIKLHIKL